MQCDKRWMCSAHRLCISPRSGQLPSFHPLLGTAAHVLWSRPPLAVGGGRGGGGGGGRGGGREGGREGGGEGGREGRKIGREGEGGKIL